MIYLDFAATTKPSPEALNIFNEVNEKFWANPDSMHDFGIKAEAVLTHARKNILESFNAEDEYNLIFTSSATESNNLVLKNFANLQKQIISSNIEHASVLEPLLFLQQKQKLNVEFLPVNQYGVISLEDFEKKIGQTTVASIMHVNNEIGSVNDVFEMAKIIKRKNKQTLFHSDFSQSVGKLPVSLKNSNIDFVSFSGHKIECVKGIGALIFKKNITINPQLHGGNQEFGFRASTSNTAAAAALAKSVKIAVKLQKERYEKVQKLQKILLDNLSQIPAIQINTPANEEKPFASSPFIVNFSVPKQKSETILRALSLKEIYISTVSACSAKKAKESYVVKALFNDKHRAASSMRVSLSAETTETEILTFIEELKKILDNL
ncbi:MAG: cysteine desulfurase [Chitinivibrionia bacterium]|nr:cysteine desulfurase [Chitinivibrionia bacterium]